MELSLIEICEKIASTNAKSHNKPDLYDSASKIINSFLNNEVPSNFLLTGQAVQNIQSDLTARDEALKVSASHLFLTLVQLSRTLAPEMAHEPNSWTLPIQTFASNIKYLVQTCFPLLGSTNTLSQQKSLSVVVQHIDAIKAWSDQTNEEAHTLLTNLIEMRILPRLEDMLGEPEREELLAMKIWQQLIHSIGNYIPKTNHELINRLLKLIEFCFKNTRQEVQLCAYTSWTILIKTFSLHPTYLVKKLRLFNVPLLSCAVKQDHRYAPVDVERAKTWSQLMVSLTPELQDHASTVCTPFFFFCIGLDPKITLLRKFNEAFKSHFHSFIDDNINLVERSWKASFLDSNINFLNLLSGPNNTQHLPKKALSDPQTLYDWRTQLCIQGIQSLAALVQIEEPASHLSPRYAVFNEISTDLCQFSNNASYLTARDDWVRENHRVLLALIGLSIHLFDPRDGFIVAECFSRILRIMMPLHYANDQLFYSLLAVCQTALAKRHTVQVIVSLVDSIYHSYAQVFVPIHESSYCTIAHLLIEILLDPHVLTFEETLPESFYNSYQNLLSCRNLRTIGLSDFQHFLTKLDTSNNDPTNLWRVWKLTAEGLLLAMQSSTYAITSNTPDFSVCCSTLSFVLTRFKRTPNPISIVRECSDIWKNLFNEVLELISIDERNQFIDSLSQHINSITESQLQIPHYTHFLTFILDELVSHLDLSSALVYSAAGTLSSSDSQSLEPSDKLGNIAFSVSALSKLLNFTHSTLFTHNDTDVHTTGMECPGDSASVISLLTTTMYLFSQLTNPQLIQNMCTCISLPIGLYFQTASTGSPHPTDSITSLLVRLWEAIKAAILTNFEAPCNTEFLLILCPLLLPIFHSSDESILSSACDFFSKTFVSCSEDIDFPDSLKRVLTSLPVKKIMEQHSHIDGKSNCSLSPVRSGKMQTAKKKLEERDSPTTTPASKKICLTSPLVNNNMKLSDQSSLIIPASITSNDSTIDTTKPKYVPVSSPCEEDPLPVSDPVITVCDETSNATAETSPRVTSELPGSCRFSKSPSNFYSDQKPRFKQSKFIKISDTDKCKSKGNWQPSPSDKEKKAFFKLELTPIKLEEFPKSSPTHQSVSRKLQFPADEKNLEEIYDQETVSLSLNSPDVEILGLDTEPVHDHIVPPADYQRPENNLNLNEAELDSVDEFIKNIPLSDIVSPDEMLAMQFADASSAEDPVDSEGTGSLLSITSSSVSQSVTPPFSGIESPPHIQTEAESILAFNECILASEESIPIDSDLPLIESSEPMEIQDENVETELEHNESTDSIPPDLNTSALLKEVSPETTSVLSSQQPNTPKQSILKKQSTYSPSPSFKKVSFANPIHETHAISISPRAKKLRTQRLSSTSKLTSATTSIGTRRGTRLGATGALNSNPDDPICTALLECSEPVDKLIPFLNSQFVSRGIAGLLKAKKIDTIGDLAKLNEREAENLPIQPPKMLTLRTAFSKYQVTQLSIVGDLIRQESHPLFFPLTRSDAEEVEEDTVERERDNVAPVAVAELPDVEFVNATDPDPDPDCMAVSIQECPLGEILDVSPELISTGIQTESASSTELILEIGDTLPRELHGLSQAELSHILTSLCQLIPSVAQELNNK